MRKARLHKKSSARFKYLLLTASLRQTNTCSHPVFYLGYKKTGRFPTRIEWPFPLKLDSNSNRSPILLWLALIYRKVKSIELIKWKSNVLLWAYREGLYTNWMSVLNVSDNIIRMSIWILCGYIGIMLLWFNSSMMIDAWNMTLLDLHVEHHGLTDVLNW